MASLGTHNKIWGVNAGGYSQWHGAYEVLHSLAELSEMAEQKRSEAGLE